MSVLAVWPLTGALLLHRGTLQTCGGCVRAQACGGCVAVGGARVSEAVHGGVFGVGGSAWGHTWVSVAMCVARVAVGGT